MEEKIQRVLENGVMEGTLWHCDNIRLGHGIVRYNSYAGFTTGNSNDVVRMHFGMKGDYSFTYKQLNTTYELVGSHHNIMWSDGFDLTVKNKTLYVETFGVQFPKEEFVTFTQNSTDLMKRFADNILAGKNVMLSPQWGAIDPAIQTVIQQVINCRFSGELKKLFLLSKSIELLVLCAESYDRALSKKENIIKTKTDKEKIIAVRDLIIERLHAPPNLSEIARTVGLNEYKLKRGFKETFDTTVFGYLTDQRLQLAHQYLRDTPKNAAEIAYDLGYATPQHFNNAFKSKFGITPGSVRNNP